MNLRWNSGRDWVWPRHASPGEIQAYLEEQIGRHDTRVRGSATGPDPSTLKVDPFTGQVLPDPEQDYDTVMRERAARVRALAEQWTADYFRALTHRHASP